MTPTLERLTYRSRARTDAQTPEALADILQLAQINNIRDGLTGALTLSGGWFVQVVEGPPAAIASLLERLEVDPRHSDIEIAARSAVEDRLFGDWSMASVDLEPQLEPALRSLQDNWDQAGPETAGLLAEALSLD